ncbi:hypothetical protein Taro_048530 [Colocasia esculenta]|uniref:Uncharacterized protein n=1 Tax=Colocasia esculenta TaxID=4460 RepID=A0A843X8D2_COLES|nr:hypothetical protein [Colocasia esculenta]
MELFKMVVQMNFKLHLDRFSTSVDSTTVHLSTDPDSFSISRTLNFREKTFRCVAVDRQSMAVDRWVLVVDRCTHGLKSVFCGGIAVDKRT